MLCGNCEYRVVHWHERKIERSFISCITEDSDQTIVFQAEKEYTCAMYSK